MQKLGRMGTDHEGKSMKSMGIEQIYEVLKRHKPILSRSARSFIWLYETYDRVKKDMGYIDARVLAWERLAKQTGENELVQDFARRLLNCEAVGAYLNDDQLHDCSRCKLGDCRWRGRNDRDIHCPKNTYGEWIHRPPKTI